MERNKQRLGRRPLGWGTLGGGGCPKKNAASPLFRRGLGWVTASRRILHGSAEPGLGFLFYPANFREHLQHMSHIHNCTPGLVLL